MQAAVRGKAFDRGDGPALILYGQCQAAVDPLAVHQHRPRPAGALVAALLGSGEPEMLPQEIEQRGPHVQRHIGPMFIDRELHGTSDRI